MIDELGLVTSPLCSEEPGNVEHSHFILLYSTFNEARATLKDIIISIRHRFSLRLDESLETNSVREYLPALTLAKSAYTPRLHIAGLLMIVFIVCFWSARFVKNSIVQFIVRYCNEKCFSIPACASPSRPRRILALNRREEGLAAAVLVKSWEPEALHALKDHGDSV